MMRKPRARHVEMMIGDIQRAEAVTVVAGTSGAKKIQENDMMNRRKHGNASSVNTKQCTGMVMAWCIQKAISSRYGLGC